MDKKIKALSKDLKADKDQRYVLLCAMSRDDLPDAQKAAVDLAAAGKQARVILCSGRKTGDLFRLASSDKCIYCGIYSSAPLSDELVKQLNCQIRLYLFLKQERRKDDRRTGDRRTGDRRSGERRTKDRRTGDRRSEEKSADTSEPLQDNRGGSDRRDSDRRSNDRRDSDRRSGDRRNADRRGGTDRRQDENPQPIRVLYSVLIDEAYPKGQQVRCFEKAGTDNAVTLAEALDGEQSGEVRKETEKAGPNGYLIALIIAAVLGVLYFLARLAPYFGCA